ncbi:phosphate acyltransferase PlsX [Dactylosporangium sp. CA-152071]|uniref:phosphate acyltransferase PlsX n=1 Tax=Dactylosporangium sp. CA-152071 TaxID=3239933 RepID=UPI003D89E49E
MTRSDRSPHGGQPPSGTARIAVDLLGGDSAPAVVVDGALRACSADPDLHLLLVGPRESADEVIGALAVHDRERVSVSVVDRTVGMGDAPMRHVRRESTVRAAAEAVYAGRADAMVSAGSSGAAVAASAHVLGRLRGVRRPGLAAHVPTPHGPVLLLDVGVTIDGTMLELVQHAVLGAAYAKVALGVTDPRVGLLSIGSEPGKGDRLRRAVAVALSDTVLPAGGRYIGLVEGHDVPRGGPADVIVTDGFTGNILLKGIEGATAASTAAAHHTGAVEAPHVVAASKGAALLGVTGAVVVCHGSADGPDIASGIALAARLHRERIIPAVAGLADELLTELSSAGGLTIRDALGERS